MEMSCKETLEHSGFSRNKRPMLLMRRLLGKTGIFDGILETSSDILIEAVEPLYCVIYIGN